MLASIETNANLEEQRGQEKGNRKNNSPSLLLSSHSPYIPHPSLPYSHPPTAQHHNPFTHTHAHAHNPQRGGPSVVRLYHSDCKLYMVHHWCCNRHA